MELGYNEIINYHSNGVLEELVGKSSGISYIDIVNTLIESLEKKEEEIMDEEEQTCMLQVELEVQKDKIRQLQKELAQLKKDFDKLDLSKEG